MQAFKCRNIKDTSGHNMVRIEKRERIMVPAYLFGHKELRDNNRTAIIMKYDSNDQRDDILKSISPSNWINIIEKDNGKIKIVDAGNRNTLKYIAKRIYFGRERIPCLKHSMQYFYSGRLMWFLRKYRYSTEGIDFSWASDSDPLYFGKWLEDLYSINTVAIRKHLLFASVEDKERYDLVCDKELEASKNRGKEKRRNSRNSEKKIVGRKTPKS